jgi:hypothetical protein
MFSEQNINVVLVFAQKEKVFLAMCNWNQISEELEYHFELQLELIYCNDLFTKDER